MTTDENILIEMFERATNSSRSTVDYLAVQMFCMIVQSNNALVIKAHELIAKRLYSSNTTEAARAIALLEECMSKGGVEFQKKTAKFTFLNEIIALVLDKHPGVPVPIETKKRIMECLMLWTVEHQDKNKIQEAYENLKKQVNFPQEPTANSNPQDLASVRDQRCSILGKDDEIVAKLLKQGGVENYKKANLLIQHRFNQEARRTEFMCHLKHELKKIKSTMEVLDEMLNSYSSEATEAESRATIQDLYSDCKSHNEQMARWPDFLAESEPEFLEDVLCTKDHLINVVQRYKDLFENEKPHNVPEKLSIKRSQSENTDLLSELFGDTLIPSSEITNSNKPNTAVKESDTMDELNGIFGTNIDKIKNDKPHHPSELLDNLNLLEPISVFETENVKAIANEKDEKKGNKIELSEIDKLSEEIFKQSLNNERMLSFKKETKKITLIDMAKNKIQSSLNVSSQVDNIIKPTLEDFKDDFTELKEYEKPKPNPEFQEKEDLKLDIELNHKKNTDDGPSTLVIKHLADISIDLDDVTPLDEGQRLLLDDDDIEVTLSFTADHPSEHVSVIVMTVTNKSKLPVRDFQFEASVKKPCKVRLLPPTDVTMAPRKPFRISPPINQVMLLLNPTRKPVDITCIIGYKLGDDPDPIKESVVTKDIPYF